MLLICALTGLSNSRRYFVPFFLIENELSSPGMIFRGLPVFTFFFLSGSNGPGLLNLSLWSGWQDLVVEVFAPKTDLQRAIYSFFQQYFFFGTNSGWLLFGKLVPLVVKSDSKVILDRSFGLARENA